MAGARTHGSVVAREHGETFDAARVKAAVRECDPIFDAADAGFVRRTLAGAPEGDATAILWEANLALCADEYSDSGSASMAADSTVVRRVGSRTSTGESPRPSRPLG